MYLDAAAAASCKVVPTEECTPKCELVAGEKVCAARLTTECAGGCTATASVSCTSSCETSFVPNCTSQSSQPPNCMGLCMSDCQQDCNAKCSGAADQGECRSSCAQCCSVDCHQQCDAPPAPMCDPTCATACAGSCEGKANIDCQVSCQSSLYTECETEVVEECKNECKNTGAAIFCDGQFLATAGDLQACAAALEAEFKVHLDVTIHASGSCDSDSCTGKVDASADSGFGCSVADDRSDAGGGMAGGLLALVGLGFLRSRRNRRSA
jgi:MYXO-CTERM domain-containing protein